MLKDIIRNTKSPWTTADGQQADYVLCSRIRLARNFACCPFPLKQTEASAQKVLDIMQEFCRRHPEYYFYSLDDISPLDRQVLVEKHLISREHAAVDRPYKGLVLNEEGSVSIMVNEEDHLRIQCFAPGLDLSALWQKASVLDDQIEEIEQYAFNEKLGYLTCCPTNLGDGLRGSVMMHLPALAITKQLGILNQLSNLGMTVRGLYGEGSDATGDLYQISNQVTLGQTEHDILTNLHSITLQIIKEERNAREFLREHNNDELEDQVWRAMGTLTHARYLSSQETLRLISLVRLGYSMGYLEQLTFGQINDLYLLAQPGYLQEMKGEDMDAHQRDAYRAQKVNEKLSE